MQSIKVVYFASLREKASVQDETLELTHQNFAELYEHLNQKYAFGLPSEMIQVAVNDEFASMKDQIKSGDKIVFIPPVAGG